MTFPCIYVLYPELLHPIFLLFYLSPLIVVISTGLKILYSFLNRKYIPHLYLLYFLLLTSPEGLLIKEQDRLPSLSGFLSRHEIYSACTPALVVPRAKRPS
jgi:hypothetical protein